ncbi:formate dehydrogenase H [Salmonella enterica subsp. enterica]|nr:formate dehydrogenase H [Salmonella enterica subsp. enterica]
MSNAINEIDNTDLVFVFGYNPADSHPIVANHVINAKRNGAKIIVCDPRKIETARIADMHIALKNGSNIALLNAMGHVIIEENLYDKAFVASRTEGFEEYSKIVEGYTPESVEEITGVSAQEIRQAARMYASAKSAAILWGMGVTQFYQGVETVRSLTSLAMLTGNLGKPSAGVNPVRGQNNVQGACDMGALPDTYPGYQYVKFPENREKFAKAWGVESLPAHTGYRISELPHRAAHGEVRAAYIMGEDPLQTDAELSAVRKAFEDLELVIVQDIFMTKTASAADVILPSTSWGEHEGVFSAADRGFQRFFKAVEPKWDLKTDWQIISEIATPDGLSDALQQHPRRSGMSCVICARISTAPLTRKWAELGYIQWPCRDTSDADQGTSYLFKEKFDTPNGLAQFFTCDWVAPIDKLTEEYPMVLSTVREVGHYSCRSMTGNCAALAALADEPGYAQINTADAARLGIEDEALVWVHSRKGKIITRAQVSDRPNKGAIYMTYQWWIGACNELVTENLSPITKTPEYKYCAVRVEPIADQRAAEQYVIDEYNKLKTRLRESAMG